MSPPYRTWQEIYCIGGNSPETIADVGSLVSFRQKFPQAFKVCWCHYLDSTVLIQIFLRKQFLKIFQPIVVRIKFVQWIYRLNFFDFSWSVVWFYRNLKKLKNMYLSKLVNTFDSYLPLQDLFQNSRRNASKCLLSHGQRQEVQRCQLDIHNKLEPVDHLHHSITFHDLSACLGDQSCFKEKNKEELIPI